MRNAKPRESDAAGQNEAIRSSLGGERDDLLAGQFDQTNGVVTGLDGESDGTIEGESLPAAFRTGPMRAAHLWDPSHRFPVDDLPPEDDAEPVDARSRSRRLHLRR